MTTDLEAEAERLASWAATDFARRTLKDQIIELARKYAAERVEEEGR